MSAPPLADRLTTPAAPWVHLLVIDDPGPNRSFDAPDDFRVGILDGRRCPTKAALLEELARVFEFPPHFGRNWDALEDCLTDLTWRPGAGYWLFVYAADRLLADDPPSYDAFLTLLADVGRAWGTSATGHPGRGPVPFHTVLLVFRRHLGARADWRAVRPDD